MADLDGYYSFDEDDIINDHIQEVDEQEFPEEFYESVTEPKQNENESLLQTQPFTNPEETVTANNVTEDDNDEAYLDKTIFLEESINEIPLTREPPRAQKKKQRKLYESFDRFTNQYEWRSTTKTTNIIPQDMNQTWKKKKTEADNELVQYLNNQWNDSRLQKENTKNEDRYKVQSNRMVQCDDIPITLPNGDRIHIPKRNTTPSKKEYNYFTTKRSQYTPPPKKAYKKHALSCSDLWVDKYSPNNFLHLLSNEKINRNVLKALREWDTYVFQRKKDTRPEPSKRIILLTGAPGIGKTTLAHIVSKHAGYNPIEINASLDRSSLLPIITNSMSCNTLTSKQPNSIILDEVDGLDTSTLKPLVQMFKNDVPKVTRPIILIANNKYANVLRPLLPYVTSFHVNPPETTRLVSRCKHILSQEYLSMNQTQLLYQLIHSANNDIRSCLFTLQFISSAARANVTQKVIDLSSYLADETMWKDDRMDNISILKSIFRKNKKEMISLLLDGGNDITKLLDGVFLNVPYIPFIDPNLDKLYTACEWLSIGDLYRSSNSTSLASNHPHDFILLQKWYIPVMLSAVHALCRTHTTRSQKPLIYSTKELFDLRYNKEANRSLLQQFISGLNVNQQCYNNSVKTTLLDTIPFLLYFLQAGNGKHNIKRAVSAYEFYREDEKVAFDIRMKVFKEFGLKYKTVEDEDGIGVGVKLEPEIDLFMRFRELDYLGGSCDIPLMVRVC